MNVPSYGTSFVLIQDERILSIEEVKEIFHGVFGKIKLVAAVLGVSFDGNYLMPSANGMAQSHLKCEFTLSVKAQAEIVRLSVARERVRKSIAKLRKAHKGDADSFAVEYVRTFGTLKIEGEGARATNYGIGCTLTINGGDTQEAREVVEMLTTIVNKDSRNERALESLYLTTIDEVCDIMIACGLGDEFLAIFENIRPNEIVTKRLSEYEESAKAVA